MQTGYSEESVRKRGTEAIIGDLVRNWTTHINDNSGAVALAQVLDLIFIQESSFDGVRRLYNRLEGIGAATDKNRTSSLPKGTSGSTR